MATIGMDGGDVTQHCPGTVRWLGSRFGLAPQVLPIAIDNPVKPL